MAQMPEMPWPEQIEAVKRTLVAGGAGPRGSGGFTEETDHVDMRARGPTSQAFETCALPVERDHGVSGSSCVLDNGGRASVHGHGRHHGHPIADSSTPGSGENSCTTGNNLGSTSPRPTGG
eukprot:6201685-Prymnesium_polylepis.1